MRRKYKISYGVPRGLQESGDLHGRSEKPQVAQVIIKRIPKGYDDVNRACDLVRRTSNASGLCQELVEAQYVNMRIPRKDKIGSVRLGSWNVGSLSGRSLEVTEVLSRKKIDICCLQEVRWRNSGARMLKGPKEKYKLFWMGNDKAEAGVGIMISERWINKVVGVVRISNRCMMVKVTTSEGLVNIISGYAPQSGRKEEEKDLFWEEMNDLMAGISEKEMVVVGGDLNGHVGKESTGYEEVHGGNGYGERNKDGERILDFGITWDMRIYNTWFKKKTCHLITYESGGVKSTVDYIIAKRKSHKCFKNVRVFCNEECVKQHKLLVCEFVLRPEVKIRKRIEPKIKTWKLREPEYRGAFQTKIQEMGVFSEKEEVEKSWVEMKNNMLNAAESVCQVRKRPARHKETWWWNEVVEKAIKDKKEGYKKWVASKKDDDYSAYRKLRQKAKQEVAIAKRIYYKNLTEKMNKKEGINAVYRMAKVGNRERQDVVRVNCIKDSKGQIVIDPEEREKVWREYMEKLLNEENNWDGDVAASINEAEVEYITKVEVIEALKKMKTGKAAGFSNVVTEMLRAAGVWGIEKMTELFNMIIRNKQIPEDWEKSIILPIYKGKGDPVDCGSYRAIKLLEHTMKVMERILEKRIRDQVKIDDMQFGFSPGKSTMDAIFIVRQMQEKFRAKNKTLYFAFVDLEKAYDKVPREVVRWALRKSGVKEWLVETIMCMYKRARTAVKTDDSLGKWFDVQVGLHQGSALSPLLFIVVLEMISKEIRGGLPWEILYADDLVLMAENVDELKEKLSAWKYAMERKGLKVNVGKTKVLWKGEEADIIESGKFPCAVCGKGVGGNSILCIKCNKWTHKRCSGMKVGFSKGKEFICKRCKMKDLTLINGDTQETENFGFERVSFYCYLGDLLSEDGGADRAVENRIKAGWKKFRELTSVLCSRGIPSYLKGKVFKGCIRKCLLYGSETWAMTAENLRRLERTEMQMLRLMKGVSRRNGLSNEEIKKEFLIDDLLDVVRSSRLRWFGHVERKVNEDWVKKCRTYEVKGIRKSGRPKITWEEVLSKDMRALDLTPGLAQDRDEWRKRIDKCNRTERPGQSQMTEIN